MIAAGAAEGSSLCDAAFSVFAAMAIRRQVDKSGDVHSLRSILEDMRSFPGAMSRQTVLDFYAQRGPQYDSMMLDRLVDSTWSGFSDATGGGLDVAKIDDDPIASIAGPCRSTSRAGAMVLSLLP